MTVWDGADYVPDTPEVHGDGVSAPSRAAQLDARDDFNADYDARADANIEAYHANPLCLLCGEEIAEGDVIRATLVYPFARLVCAGECSTRAFEAHGRVTGKYSARGMRGLKIGRAES